jgi:ankyrin repeat protein
MLSTNGFNALMMASGNGYLSIARLLCEHGADKSAITASGATALLLARMFVDELFQA